MALEYFKVILNEFNTYLFYANEDADNLDNLKLHKMDFEMIKLCLYLEELDYTTGIDEQRNGSFRSMIAHLQKIWVGENRQFETRPIKFHFGHELESRIQESKTLIEQRCQVFIRSSTSMHCKSSTNHRQIYKFIRSVSRRLVSLIEYLPLFKNQFHILGDKLGFMSVSWFIVGRCTDSNELDEYRNFVHAFSNNAASLACMYWAKEEETATEMNTALFDILLHKIKPSALHVIICYFSLLKSNNKWHIVSKQRYLADFVDLFFAHNILKDDFLIFRERLRVLLRFLAYAPEENRSSDADLICSQIKALFCEDVYLLLPISEMKENFSNKKMLLSDFIVKIDLLTTSIISFSCEYSDSWNRLEAHKMNKIYFASFQRELINLECEWTKRNPYYLALNPYIAEIRFLRSFLRCFETWDDSDEQTRLQLHSVVTSLQRIWGQEYDMELLSGRLYTIRKEEDMADWEHLIDSELKEKLEMSKQEINAWLRSLSHCPFQCRSSTSNKTLNFLVSILKNLSYLMILINTIACKDVAFKKKIEILEEKLLLMKNFLVLATDCADIQNLEEFNMFVQAFANNTACFLYMWWIKEAKDESSVEMDLMFSIMLQKIKPKTPHVARMYVGTLMAISLQPYDYLLLIQTVTSFVDYFFEDMATPWKNDFQIIRDEVIFHLTFVHHHHHHAKEITSSQLNVLFSDGVYDLLPFDDMKGHFLKKKVCDIMINIQTENANIRKLCCEIPSSLMNNFPRIIGQGFLDCLLQKLRNLIERMYSDQKHEAKDMIMTIEKELVYLTPIFNNILALKELYDAWLRVVNVFYTVEHVISLCSIYYHQLCQYIPHISDVVEMIKAVRTDLEIIECNMHNDTRLPHLGGFTSTLLEQDPTSKIHGLVVGFEEDKKIIINNITSGIEPLDIVSIVGMGGLGKTTLAKMVYDSLSVKSHFNRLAFAYVSQDHNKRRLLLDILKDIIGFDAGIFDMSEDDLAHKLWKSLSRQKYFIVLDDIWNINAWDEVKSSFPDDRNGSRVMFTTRSYAIAERCKIQCIPHHLRFLTEDESWELFQKKVFCNDIPPPNLSVIGKLVVKKCDGLPLAIVVIAGLLAKTETSLWNDISQRVSSYLSDDEGCRNIFELSYNNLPEYLKPCLLYLGAFPNDRSYKVRQVILLWIAEGFIKESEAKSLNNVAKKYLNELVDRSFIIVDETTIGEISTFRVHDLIYDLCQKKCLDKNFFKLEPSCLSTPSKYNQYRVSMHKQYKPSLTNTHSLLFFPTMFDHYQGIFPSRFRSEPVFHLEHKVLPISDFRLAQVLYLEDTILDTSDLADVTSLIDLRHIQVGISHSVPSSISNLWNLQSLIMKTYTGYIYYLPETFWRMKSLRHVKISNFRFLVSEGWELNEEYPQLDRVVSFSRPYLSTVKDVEWLMKRLPAVRELGCILDYKSVDSIEETFDFYRELESLKIQCNSEICPYLINFPPTLMNLTLEDFKLTSTVLSTIVQLECLTILRLRDVCFPEPTWETEDVIFTNLKYFELCKSDLVQWNADVESFPVLEEIYFAYTLLEELPPCLGEIASLKKITFQRSPKLGRSALWVQKEQMDWGNKVGIFSYRANGT